MKHISEIIDDILVEWSFRVHDGMPNPENPLHLVHLEDTLNELSLPRKVSEKLLQNVRIMQEDWWSDYTPEQQAQYIKDHPKSEKAQSAKKEKVMCQFQYWDSMENSVRDYFHNLLIF